MNTFLWDKQFLLLWFKNFLEMERNDHNQSQNYEDYEKTENANPNSSEKRLNDSNLLDKVNLNYR